MSADATRHFVREIIARHGDRVVPHVMSSLQGYVDYASGQWGNVASGIRELLAELMVDLQTVQTNESMSQLATTASTATDKADADLRPSEILREIWARGPQHREFRKALEMRWKSACSVHGVQCNGQLRASHIVAWRLSEELRGDVDNGLLLSVPLDSLFDCGLISFSNAGEMLLSRKLHHETKLHFGLQPGQRVDWSHLTELERNRIRKNLAKHRLLYAEENGYES
jgi:hypothetical protein